MSITIDPIRLQPNGNAQLTVLLRDHCARVRRQGKNQAQIARDAWLDESYVSRLFSGERFRPSREALILIGGWGLGLAVEYVDELLLAADYKPLVLPATLR